MADEHVEPWLRGTHTEIDPVRRAVLHALELGRDDVRQWCVPLDAEGRESEPLGLPSVGFQMRHIARSLDRLMTYAEGRGLSQAQLAALEAEHEAESDVAAEFEKAVSQAVDRLLRFRPEQCGEERRVGRAGLPTTLAGLLIHIAEHTQRHVGQAITTAKVVRGLRKAQAS